MRVLGDAPNQKDRLREDVDRSAAALRDFARAGRGGHRGRHPRQRARGAGLPRCVAGGIGAAAIDNLMEDAATAEISRSQLWLWRTRGLLADATATPTHPRRGAGPARWRRDRSPGRCRATCSTASSSTTHFADFLTHRAYAILE